MRADKQSDQIELETAILQYNHEALGDEVHIVESDQEALAMQMHNRTGACIQTIHAGLQHQIDPSYE